MECSRRIRGRWRLSLRRISCAATASHRKTPFQIPRLPRVREPVEEVILCSSQKKHRRHGLDDLAREQFAHRAEADEGGRLERCKSACKEKTPPIQWLPS